MKFTKPVRAITAALFAGALALTGCSAGGEGATNSDPKVNKFTYDVELEADGRTPEKLDANVEVQLELKKETLKEMREASGDDKLSAKESMEGQKKLLAQQFGISEDKMKVTEKSEQVASFKAKDLTEQELEAVTSVKAGYTEDGTYIAQAAVALVAGNPQQEVEAELNLTLPAAVTEANVGGQINGNTVTWTSENLEEAVKAKDVPEALIAETRVASTVDQTPIWLSAVIFALGVIAAALMVALAVTPGKKATPEPNTPDADAAEGNA